MAQQMNYENIIKKLYSAINQFNLDQAIALMLPTVIRSEPANLSGKTFHGHLEMRSHLEQGRSSWAEGTCEPIEFFASKNKVVIRVKIQVRLKNETNWIKAEIFDGVAFESGLVSEFHTFANRDQADSWAGI